MSEIASISTLPEFIRQDAQRLIEKLQFFERNYKKHPASSNNGLTLHEAFALMSELAENNFSLDDRLNAAVALLKEVVIDVNAERYDRQEAANFLASFLKVNEITSLIQSITDLNEEGDELSNGVIVVLILIKTLGKQGEIILLERIANNKENRGWIREIACETIGTFFDPKAAITYLDLLIKDGNYGTLLQKTITKAKQYYLIKESQLGGKKRTNPIVEEAFNAFIQSNSVEAIVDLNVKYKFITDPEFIEQLEQYLHYSEKALEKELLEKKIKRLKELPANIQQLVYRTFARAKSLEEMKEATVLYPILTTKDFQKDILETIERDEPEEDKPSFYKKLEWLKVIKPSKEQLTIDAFMNAQTFEELKTAALVNPFLRSDKFYQMAEQIKVIGHITPPLDVRLQWLSMLDPDPIDEMHEAAWNAVENGNYEAALEKVDQIALVDPDRQMYLLRGVALFQLGEVEKAIEELTFAIEINPSSLALEMRGRAYMYLNRVTEAIADFSKALQLEPDFFKALLGRGQAYLILGNWYETIKDLEGANKLKPNDELVIFSLGFAYMGYGDTERALEAINSISQWSSEFIEQVDKLRGDLTKLKKSDPGQEAMNALFNTTNVNDIVAAIRDHPILQDKNFLDYVAQYINEEPNDDVWKAMMQRYNILLSIVNPAQAAFNAFMSARDEEEMKMIVKQYPMLQQESFIAQIKQMETNLADDRVVTQIRQQLKVLKKLKL